MAHQIGRSWSIQELREKSWEDLHCLWWVCVKERNRIATSNLERQRLKAGYGEWEASERDRTVSFSFLSESRPPYFLLPCKLALGLLGAQWLGSIGADALNIILR